MKVLIADDDQGMRLVLKKVIGKAEGFEIIGEAGDGETTLALAEELSPNVIFLDVEMPVMSGIECAKRIADINPKTILIFATAHESYMQDAFEVYAFDYLVKPFKVDRIFQTLDRIRELFNGSEKNPIHEVILREKGFDKLMISNKDGISLVDMQDIQLIQRENRSTVIYTGSDRYVTSESLSDIEKRLNSGLFFRSHKSYIVNLSLVHKIYPYGRWTYIIKLRNTDKDALLTHEKYEELKKIFRL